MRRLLDRLISRLYAERARLTRRRLGVAGETSLWVSLDVAVAGPASPPSPGLEAVFVEPEELRARPVAYWLDPSAAAAHLAGGDRCLAVKRADEVIYRAIVMRDPARVAAMVAGRDVRPPAIVVSGVYTHPAFRGRGVHAFAMGWLAAASRRDGVGEIVAWVSAWNRSSLRAFARAGFRPLDGRDEAARRPG